MAQRYTRTILGHTLKNDARVQGDRLILLLPTYPDRSELHCDLSDLPLIAPHRWRLAGNRVVTTLHDPEIGHEVAVEIANVLLQRPRHEQCPHRDGNPVDARRVNLAAPRLPHVAEPTPHSVTGDSAALYLPCGSVAELDASDLPRVLPYRWHAVNKDRETGSATSVRAYRVTEHGHSPVLLHRLILDIPQGAHVPVQFSDGNRLNFRKSNLIIGAP